MGNQIGLPLKPQLSQEYKIFMRFNALTLFINNKDAANILLLSNPKTTSPHYYNETEKQSIIGPPLT